MHVSYGVGKTTIAEALVKKIKESICNKKERLHLACSLYDFLMASGEGIEPSTGL